MHIAKEIPPANVREPPAKKLKTLEAKQHTSKQAHKTKTNWVKKLKTQAKKAEVKAAEQRRLIRERRRPG